MKKDLIISLTLHLVVVLLLIFGKLPSREMLPPEHFIPVDIVDIGEITQSNRPPLPKSEDPKPEAKPQPSEEKPLPEPEPKTEKNPEPPVAEEKEPTPEPKPEPVPEETSEPQDMPVETPEPKSEELVEEEAALEELKKEEKLKEQEKKKEPIPPTLPKKKPAPPKEEEKEKKKPAKPFASVLKNILKTKSSSSQPADDAQESNEEEASEDAPTKPVPLGEKTTASEKDIVRQQLMRCWNPPSGAKNAHDLKIAIKLKLTPDATVQKAEVVDRARMHSDSFFRTAAESALRAVRNPKCSPLKLPLNKYEEWKTMTITFDPKDM